MTLKEYVAAERWVVYQLDVPRRKFFGDTAFGPMWKSIPEEVAISQDEQELVLDSMDSVLDWISSC